MKLQQKPVPFPDPFPHLLKMASAELVLTADTRMQDGVGKEAPRLKKKERRKERTLKHQKYHRKHINNIRGSSILASKLHDSGLKNSNNNENL